jgi:tRNA pseudouridine synthase 10
LFSCSYDLGTCSEALKKRASGVEVLNLQLASPDQLTLMKDGEEEKRKHYRAVCWADRALTPDDVDTFEQLGDLTLQQDTPVRVLHRRAALKRERVCFFLLM